MRNAKCPPNLAAIRRLAQSPLLLTTLDKVWYAPTAAPEEMLGHVQSRFSVSKQEAQEIVAKLDGSFHLLGELVRRDLPRLTELRRVSSLLLLVFVCLRACCARALARTPYGGHLYDHGQFNCDRAPTMIGNEGKRTRPRS